MSRLLTLFYCQDPRWILLLAYAAVLGFLEAWRRYGARSWFRPLCGLLLLPWCYVLLHLTLGNRPAGYCSEVLPIPFHFLKEIYMTGNWELVRSMFMNALLFFPAGLLLTVLLPQSWSRRRVTVLVCLVFTLISVTLEGVQLVYAMGRAETDDVLFNVLGAYLGTLPIVCRKK